VTISTDDRTVSDVSLTEEIARSAESLGLSSEEISAIALNGFDRAFAPAALMTPLVAEARDAWHAWSRVTIS
jgi:adenosine deaminase